MAWSCASVPSGTGPEQKTSVHAAPAERHTQSFVPGREVAGRLLHHLAVVGPKEP